MHSILKAAKLDCMLIQPYFKTICLTLLLPIAFVAINRSLLVGTSFAMCFIARTVVFPFSIVEKNHMERLLGILPIPTRYLVMGRYLFALWIGLISLLLSLVGQSLMLRALGETVKTTDLTAAALLGIWLFILYTAFQIPGYYKFGAIRGRVLIYIPIIGFLVVLLLLSKMSAVGNWIAAVSGQSTWVLATLTAVCTVCLYAVSMSTSIRIRKHMEI